MVNRNQKGPLWNLYKDFLFGRLLLRTAGGIELKGVVCSPPYIDVSANFIRKFLVLWKDGEGNYGIPEETEESEVLRWLQDEFAEDFAYVPSVLRGSQQANWETVVKSNVAASIAPPVQKAKQALGESSAPDGTEEARGKPGRGRKRVRAPSESKDVPVLQQASKESIKSQGNASGDANAREPERQQPQTKNETGPVPKNDSAPKLKNDSDDAGPAQPKAETGNHEQQDPGEYRQAPNGKSYPKEVCLRPGDKTIQEFIDNPVDLEGDFVVEKVVDEEQRGKTKWYLVKWKGYELNFGDPSKDIKGDWEPEKNLAGNVALKKWKTEPKPSYFYSNTKKT